VRLTREREATTARRAKDTTQPPTDRPRPNGGNRGQEPRRPGRAGGRQQRSSTTREAGRGARGGEERGFWCVGGGRPERHHGAWG
jgi:hypothetical protein